MTAHDPAGGKPVFVDPTGRRSRHLQRGIWVLAGLFGCYLVLVVGSLVGTPGVSRLTVPGVGPVLPGPRAPQIGTTSGTRRDPAQVLPPAVSPSPTAARRTAPPVPSATGPPRPSPVVPPPVSPSAAATPPRATPPTAASPSNAASPGRPSPRNTRTPTARPSRNAP